MYKKACSSREIVKCDEFQNLRYWNALSDFFTVLQMLSIAKPLLWGILCMMFIMRDSKVTGSSFQGFIEKAAAID